MKMNKIRFHNASAYIKIILSIPIATAIYNALTSFVVNQPYNVHFIQIYGLCVWDIIMTTVALMIYSGVSYLLAPVPVKRKAFFVGFAFCGLQASTAKASFLLQSSSIETAIKTQNIASLFLWAAAMWFIIISYRKTVIATT
jgi:hypothetical protein